MKVFNEDGRAMRMLRLGYAAAQPAAMCVVVFVILTAPLTDILFPMADALGVLLALFVVFWALTWTLYSTLETEGKRSA